MSHLFLFFITALLSIQIWAHSKHDDHKKHLRTGGSVYTACYYCHSLQPNVHLSGPSLANMWGKKAGQVKDFKLYSDALKNSNIVWNEENLRKWIAKPQELIPGNTMTFDGLEGKEIVEDLVKFLKIAMGPNGYKKSIEMKLIDAKTANGQLPKDLSKPADHEVILDIEHCHDIYTVTTKDKKQTRYWEMNLYFLVNSSAKGPQEGQAVRIPTGSMGDRFAVIFKSAQDMSKIIRKCNETKK